jgi:hypothetical protein
LQRGKKRACPKNELAQELSVYSDAGFRQGVYTENISTTINSHVSHLQNSIGDCKKCQGTTSVVPRNDQKVVGL